MYLIAFFDLSWIISCMAEPDPVHLPEKLLSGRIFPGKTLGRMDIIPNVHFPERTLARMYIFLNVHFPEITFS